MTNEEMQRTIETRDSRLDTVARQLAPLAERLSSLVRFPEIQNERLARREERRE